MDYFRINNGDYVKHFKRGMSDYEDDDLTYIYKVLHIGVYHTESNERLVVYQAMYGDRLIYARPISMFYSEVDSVKYPNAKQVYRLEVLSDDEYARLIGEKR